MKKILTLLILLTAYVSTASAVTLYVNVDNISWWENHVRIWAYGGTDATKNFESAEKVVVGGREWYAYEMTNGNTKAKVQYWYVESETPKVGKAQSAEITVVADCFVMVYNDGEEDSKSYFYFAQPYIPVCRNIVDDNWNSTTGNMTRVDDNTYTYEWSKASIGGNNVVWFRIFYWDTQLYRKNDADRISIGESTSSYNADPNESEWAFGVPVPTTYDYDKIVITVKSNSSTPGYTISADAYVAVRTNSNGFATFVAGAPLTISGATAYYAIDHGNGNAGARKFTNPEANTPMLIQGTADTDYEFAVATSGTALPVGVTNAFRAGSGSGISYEFGGGYNYILKGDQFYQATTENIIAPNKAYLKLSQAAAAHPLTFDDETEGINVITTNDNVEGYYNLQGVKVAAPTKGLYIHNGKKLFIK